MVDTGGMEKPFVRAAYKKTYCYMGNTADMIGRGPDKAVVEDNGILAQDDGQMSVGREGHADGSVAGKGAMDLADKGRRYSDRGNGYRRPDIDRAGVHSSGEGAVLDAADR